jgi:hypothetical protein
MVELAAWVIGFDDQENVIEPETRHEHLAAELEQAAVRYRGASSDQRDEESRSRAVGT